MKRIYKPLYLIITIIITSSIAVFLYSGETKPFPHKPHSEMDMECKTCHTGIENSTRARDNNMPDIKKCDDECHDKSIYTQFTQLKSKPLNPVEYNHQVHIMQDLKCIKCHKGLNSKDFKAGSAFPSMKLCFECHDNSTADKKCSVCHKKKVQFPHGTHIAGGSSCEDCHPDIKESTTSNGSKDVPSKKSCNNCHDEKEKYADITKFTHSQCYKMNHKLHIQDMGMECANCHPKHAKENNIKESEKIVHYTHCFDCHDNQTASQYCMFCHLYSTSPETHRIDWSNKHKIQAGENMKDCLACHTKKGFCTDCHKGIKKPLNSHNPNFILTHRYEAATSLKKCSSCHSNAYCKNCHRGSGVTKSSKSYSKQHPSGWLTQGSSNFHKRKARMRLTTCTSCHTKNDCIYCHFTRKR